MKKIYIIALFAFLFSSCENFLDEEIKGTQTSNTIFKTKPEADYAMTGVYNALNFTSSSNMIWVFGDVASDDAVKGGSPGNQTDIGYIGDFNVKADNGIIHTYWKFAYEAISRANNVIHGSFGGEIDDATRESYIAQAKFVRAYYYFNIVNIWGKVPLRLEPNTPANKDKELSEVSAIYAAIETDLNDASKVLPAAYSDIKDKGRVTKGAAFGLLAKAQLYQNKWSESLLTIAELEKLGIYDLVDDYSSMFKLGSEDLKETVFAIRHLSFQNPGVGNSLNQWFAPSAENGYFFDAPTQNFVLAFDERTTTGATDPRLDASIGRPGQEWMNGEEFESSWSPATGYLVKKHNQPLTEVGAGVKGDGGLAYVYLRYADILLMKAECYANTDQISLAAAPLNKVRNRAKLRSLTTVELNTKTQALEAIYLERKRELGFEFHRFFDLMRWGKTIAQQALGGNLIWAEPRFYFPIPQSELNANSGIK